MVLKKNRVEIEIKSLLSSHAFKSIMLKQIQSLHGHSKGDLANQPILSAGTGKNAVLFPKPKLKERLQYIQTYSRRQSDRYMPRGPFRERVTDLTRLLRSGQ